MHFVHINNLYDIVVHTDAAIKPHYFAIVKI